MSSTAIRRVSSETRDLTPALATEFAKMPASVTERDLDPKRLKYLRETILGGIALPFMWARAKVLTDGTTYRVNGHHSSCVLAEMNGEMPQGLVAHVDDYECPDISHLPALFRQFDNRRSARTVADISGAYQMVIPELRDVPRNAARRAIEGVAWYEDRVFGADVPKGDDVFTLFERPRYRDFVLFVGRIYSVKTPEFGTQVIGAMYATFDREPTQAEIFWNDVARQGASHEEKHPAAALDAWLLAAKDAQVKPKPMEIYRNCVIAWNAFRNGEPIERFRRYNPTKGAPEVE